MRSARSWMMKASHASTARSSPVGQTISSLERGILYAPDYVINAGGIINVSLEYLCRQHGEPCDINEVRKRIAQIPERLRAIWRESDASGERPDVVADRMAQALIGRADLPSRLRAGSGVGAAGHRALAHP